MNNDLKLILTVLTNYNTLAYVAIEIPQGMSDDFWRENFLYYAEPEVYEAYRKLMPLHVQTFVQKILKVEAAFEIIKGVQDESK